ncbi:symplekin [Tetranychus urticae]|uniref:Symplekin C-terminal domain-containing protein n=1 Tax=Tetranychus urticae TaxID=32264 RepID=T1KWV8_TETUR|nr:symplekin [Tetranychus urticae]
MVDTLTEQTIDRVVELLNDAILASTDKDKVNNLRQVQELVIHNDLVDNFLDEILGFQNDALVEVRKFVVNFIEAACSKDAEFFPKLIVNLHFALNDSSPHVVKKGIHVSTLLYPKFLKWASKVKVDEILESTHEVWCNIKRYIFNLLDSSENDGVRTQCIKFMEMIVICQTKRDQWSNTDDFSLDSMENCKLVNLEQLEEEANYVFEQLLIFHGTPHISSLNLMATMQSLVILARQRSDRYLSKVIQALESLHANLPPTLAKSQVTSVRKQLKVQLTLLLKHPAAATNIQFQTQIIQLLNDLGAGQSEVYKCLQEVRKRGLKVEQANIEPKPKKIKLEPDAESSTREKLEPVLPLPSPKVTRNDANTAIDITSEDLISCLNNIANVCDLVLVSLLSLPDSMPAHFLATYTPVAAAGTPSQIKHLARLLSTQFTTTGIGKGVEEMVERAAISAKAKKSQNSEQQYQKIATLVSRGIAQEAKKQEQAQLNNQNKVKLMPTGKTLSGSVKVKQLNFEELTTELSDDMKVRMIADSVSRIIQAEERKLITCPSQLESRNKVLTHLSTEFHDHSFNVATLVRGYAFEDIRNRADLLFNLVYNEYAVAKKNGNDMSHYDNCLSFIFKELIERVDVRDRDHFLPRFFYEVPLLTPEVISQLEGMITRETSYSGITLGFSILQTLIEKKIKLRPQLLSVMLNLSILMDKPEVRAQAIKVIKYLHEIYGADVKGPIERFSLEKLQRLLDPCPIPEEPETQWTEDVIKIFLLPYLCLLPNNHKLIHDLALVYVSTIPDIKRVILRVLDVPVKGMGMDSPELLLLVETCPKGAETLVTRIIHVLTDKQPPSADLVSRVRDLYHKRVPDVRFLIPVLNGLSKREVIAALPKLIKLNQLVVKEVFNRLLGTQVESGQNYQSPLTAADLLVALHNIDPSKCDMKTVMKAISLCFAEKHIYTDEVLAIVMQLLMEQSPLPTLLMRTVIQSLSLHPRLLGFVMNILQRLILKQVWNQKKVWEGFIKCCQRTKPQSFQVLLQLPAPQLRTVFRNSPDFKPALQEHVSSFTDTQRSHLPQSILDAIFSDDGDVKEEIPQLENNEPECDGQSNSPSSSVLSQPALIPPVSIINTNVNIATVTTTNGASAMET